MSMSSFVLLQHFYIIEVSRCYECASSTRRAVILSGIKSDISGEVATKICKYIRNMITFKSTYVFFRALENFSIVQF